MMVKRDSMDACAILNVMGKFGESRCVILQQKVIQRQAQGVKRRVIHRCDLNTLVYDTAFMHPTLAAFPRRRMGTRKILTSVELYLIILNYMDYCTWVGNSILKSQITIDHVCEPLLAER